MLFHSEGKLNYRNGALVVEVEKDIAYYYFNLLTKSVSENINKPMYDPHITLIGYKEKISVVPKEMKIISFSYHSNIEYHNKYYYLRVEDQPLFLELRRDNGLDPFYDKIKGYHITIGNVK